MKFVPHVNTGWMYIEYQNQTAGCYLSLYFFILPFSPSFQTSTIFITLFSETVTPTKLTFGTHVDIGLMYGVYWTIQDGASVMVYF